MVRNIGLTVYENINVKTVPCNVVLQYQGFTQSWQKRKIQNRDGRKANLLYNKWRISKSLNLSIRPLSAHYCIRSRRPERGWLFLVKISIDSGVIHVLWKRRNVIFFPIEWVFSRTINLKEILAFERIKLSKCI